MQQHGLYEEYPLERDSEYSSEKSSFWQALEYRKQLKKIIESSASIAEIETRSQQLYEEMRNER